MFVFADNYFDLDQKDCFRILYTAKDVCALPDRTPPDALNVAPEYYGDTIRLRVKSGDIAPVDPKRPFDPITIVNHVMPQEGDPELDKIHDLRSRYSGALPSEENAYEGLDLILDWLPHFNKLAFGDKWRRRNGGLNLAKALSKAQQTFKNLEGVVIALEASIPALFSEYQERSARGDLAPKGGLRRLVSGTNEYGNIEDLIKFCCATLDFAYFAIGYGS